MSKTLSLVDPIRRLEPFHVSTDLSLRIVYEEVAEVRGQGMVISGTQYLATARLVGSNIGGEEGICANAAGFYQLQFLRS